MTTIGLYARNRSENPLLCHWVGKFTGPWVVFPRVDTCTTSGLQYVAKYSACPSPHTPTLPLIRNKPSELKFQAVRLLSNFFYTLYYPLREIRAALPR